MILRDRLNDLRLRHKIIKTKIIATITGPTTGAADWAERSGKEQLLSSSKKSIRITQLQIIKSFLEIQEKGSHP